MDDVKEALEKQIEVGKQNYDVICKAANNRAKASLSSIIMMEEVFDINVENERARITVHGKHELNLFNRARYGQEWDFKPEINWFGSSSTSDEETMLDYLMIAGQIAKDMKNPQGFCRSFLKELIIEIQVAYDYVNALIIERNNIIYSERLIREQKVLDLAISNIRTDVVIEDEAFRLYKDSRHDYPFRATIKILTATDKTVTVNIYRKGEDVSISTKRIPRGEFLSKYKNVLSEVK